MGDISEMMLDGTLCCVCGEYLDDNDSECPTMCDDCEKEGSDE